MSERIITDLDREALAALIGEVQPATDALLVSFAKSVRDRREHDHPKWEDLYCANLSAFMGEKIAPVLRRLIAAEIRVAELEAELRIGAPWTCDACGKDNRRDVCAVCETHRPDRGEEKDTAPAATSTPAEQVIYRAEYEHESIPLGLYTTLAAARAHCEGQLRSEYPATVSLVLDWIGDEDDPEQPWELVAEIDSGAEQLTGYIVTPLTVAAEYDPEAEG